MSSRACKQHRAELVRCRREQWEQAQRERMLEQWKALSLDQARAHLCGLFAGKGDRPELWHIPDWCVGVAA